MEKIIADTNFFIDLFRFKIHDTDFSKIRITKSVYDELKSMSSKKTKESVYAKLALRMIKEKNVKILKSIKNKADDDLLEYSKKGYAIATNDRELRKRIKAFGGKTIYLRSKKKLAIGWLFISYTT